MVITSCFAHSLLITRWRNSRIVSGGRDFCGWQQTFIWTLGNRCHYPSFYAFGVTLSCWRSVLQKKECAIFLYLFKILSLPLALPVQGPLAAWSSGWPHCTGITLGFSGSAAICQLLNISNARNFFWCLLSRIVCGKQGRKLEVVALIASVSLINSPR